MTYLKIALTALIIGLISREILKCAEKESPESEISGWMMLICFSLAAIFGIASVWTYL